MSAFTIIVIFILALLFIILSIVPLVAGRSDFNSSNRSVKPGTKPPH
jgi:hypothetical protein